MVDTLDAKGYATKLITRWEGFLPNPTTDTLASRPIVQIGYGTTEIDGLPISLTHPPITIQQALVFVDKRLTYDLSMVARVLTEDTILHKPYQVGALLSFAYNEGLRQLLNSNVMLFTAHELHIDAALELMEYTYAGGKFIKGLHNRRRSEAYTYITGNFDFETRTTPLPTTLQV